MVSPRTLKISSFIFNVVLFSIIYFFLSFSSEHFLPRVLMSLLTGLLGALLVLGLGKLVDPPLNIWMETRRKRKAGKFNSTRDLN